jgi:hypothetical protein
MNKRHTIGIKFSHTDHPSFSAKFKSVFSHIQLYSSVYALVHDIYLYSKQGACDEKTY